MTACAVALFLLDPSSSPLFPPCVFRAVTSLECPGCGTLRALHQLLHGDLPGALRLNPMVFVLAPFLAYHAASRPLAGIWGRALPDYPVTPVGTWLLLATIATFGVVRNLPGYPWE